MPHRSAPSSWLRTLACAACLAQSPVQAATLSAEGYAALDAGPVAAREQAIQDALRNAARQAGGQVEARTEVTQDRVLDSRRQVTGLRPTLIGVDEAGEQDGLYRVRIRAEVAPASSTGTHLRKRVTAVWFDLATPSHAQDLRDPAKALPEALLRRLEQTGRYQVPWDKALPSQPWRLDRDNLQALARASRSQFVIAGQLVDAGIQPGRWLVSPETRPLTLEVAVHDGLTGARIVHQRFSETVTGYQTRIGLEHVLDGEHARATPTGAALSRLLERATQFVDRELSCLPFAASVIKVAGDRAYLDAGSQARLAIDDKLLVYGRAGATLNTLNGEQLGIVEQVIASATVIQTQPDFAVALIEGQAKQAPVQPGDIVRFP
ncbi:MAG: flagellar assembly protein T N-terminal domain-containing protein [Pseudomonadota bacterium]